MIDKITITSLLGRGSVSMAKKDFAGYWLGPVDWGQVTGQHQTYRFPSQVGESIVSTTVGGRPLSITGWVIDGGAGDLQARCDFLNAFLSPVEDYSLEYKARKIQFRPDSSVVYSRTYRENNLFLRKFLIQATCPYPLFTDLADTIIPFESDGKLFRFPTDFGMESPVVFGSLEKIYSVEVMNSGGFAAGLVVRMKFDGKVDNPRLKNLTTGKMIGVKRSFSTGEQLEISTLPGSKFMNLYTAEGEKVNLIKYRDYETSWVQLQPGRNLLALDCDDLEQRAAMAVTVFFTPLYLEVE